MPTENTLDNFDEAIENDLESLSSVNAPLINIWIPSAFLRSDPKGSHHVYQVYELLFFYFVWRFIVKCDVIYLKIYVRIKNEEWNIYRRYSHFFNLNEKLKQKYPIVSTVSFPKKKALGNKVINEQ